MAVTAFIPVRCGSKSIPLKNIKPFYGKPLVYWILKAANDAQKVDRVIVATDCKEIEQTVRNFQFPKVEIYHRKPENAQDTSSTEDVMLEYIHHAGLPEDETFILLQATSPLTSSKDIEKAIEVFQQPSFDSVLSAVRFKRFIWTDDGVPINYDPAKRPRRQEFKGNLVENGAIYINSVGQIKRHKNRLSGKIGIFEMPAYTFIELDEPEDWEAAENLMKKYFPIYADAPDIYLFLSDVDGVLTDAGMYYSESGDELKKFNTRDGMAFQMLREAGIKTGIITSEDRKLNERRARKLKLDFIRQNAKNKLQLAKDICRQLGISLQNVAYIGDDINDKDLLENVGLAACPSDAADSIKTLPKIIVLDKKGGEGVVREFVEKYVLASLHKKKTS